MKNEDFLQYVGDGALDAGANLVAEVVARTVARTMEWLRAHRREAILMIVDDEKPVAPPVEAIKIASVPPVPAPAIPRPHRDNPVCRVPGCGNKSNPYHDYFCKDHKKKLSKKRKEEIKAAAKAAA